MARSVADHEHVVRRHTQELQGVLEDPWLRLLGTQLEGQNEHVDELREPAPSRRQVARRSECR
jgi:hypothetical protein